MSPHYHIRWLPARKLDWEKFDTLEAARQRAGELVRQGESYEIELVAEDCPVCASLNDRAAPNDPPRSKSAGG